MNIEIISESEKLAADLKEYLNIVEHKTSDLLKTEFRLQPCKMYIYLNFEEFLKVTNTQKEEYIKQRYPYFIKDKNYYFYKNNDIVSVLNDYFYHKVAYQLVLHKLNYKSEVINTGLAAYLSKNEHIDTNNYQEFKIWYLYMIRRRTVSVSYEIFSDKQNKLFISLSFLLVCYILQDNDYINVFNKEITPEMLHKTLTYYDNYFEIEKIPKEFSKNMTTEQFLYFCWQNMLYGYVDNYGVIHNNLKEIHTNYQINSLEEVIKNKVATCIEQAALQKYFFDSNGIENKIFVYRIYDKENKEKFKMHCFTLYRVDNKWRHIECTHMKMCGIHNFDTIKEALEWVLSRYDDERELIEIPTIPVGLTFQEFNEYIDTFR